MELDRQFIVRTDFPSERRGYDHEEVERHLREIADAVEKLRRRSQQRPEPAAATSVASAAAEQVRSIVEAAERSAAEIEAKATEGADRVTGEAIQQAEAERNSARGEAERMRREAEEDAREIRERAEAEAAGHVAEVRTATARMRERADAVDSDLTGLVDQLRGTVESLVQSVRSSAGSLESELSGIQSGLAQVRSARPEPLAEPEPETEPEPVAADEPTAERAAAADEDDTGLAGLGHEEDQVTPSGGDEFDAEGVVEQEDEDIEAAELADAVPGESAEGARLIALNMALNGTPREETARYLEENFDLDDQDTILDEVYARVGG